MSAYHTFARGPYVMAVSTSPGGIPKLPQTTAHVAKAGLQGDGRNHAKHIRPDRAVSLWDFEILQQLAQDGFPALVPGASGENLTTVGLNVQSMLPGTLLQIGPVIIKLEQQRKPCYVLDAIDPRLKDVIVGRCGYLASVVAEGTIRPGMTIHPLVTQEADYRPTVSDPAPADEIVAGLPGERSYHLLAGPIMG